MTVSSWKSSMRCCKVPCMKSGGRLQYFTSILKFHCVRVVQHNVKHKKRVRFILRLAGHKCARTSA